VQDPSPSEVDVRLRLVRAAPPETAGGDRGVEAGRGELGKLLAELAAGVEPLLRLVA
jgi:hypothetical protein